MKINKLFPTIVFVLLLAAAVTAGTLSNGLTALTIVPEQDYVIGDTGFLSLHVTSNAGAINFTAQILILGGSTNLTSMNLSNHTSNCNTFTKVCTFDKLWGFKIISVGPTTFKVNVTQNDTYNTKTNTTKIINLSVGVDNDNDNYYSTASGGNDCNDNLNSVHPGAVEQCNSIDDNCNGAADEGISCGGDGALWYQRCFSNPYPRWAYEGI